MQWLSLFDVCAADKPKKCGGKLIECQGAGERVQRLFTTNQRFSETSRAVFGLGKSGPIPYSTSVKPEWGILH